MKIDMGQDHFEEMTKYLSHEARWFALDSMACVFHNEGHSLKGNTAENDVRWLANSICHKLRGHGLDQLAEGETKTELMKISEVAISCLPGFAERIAHRYINLSKAIRTMETISREQATQMQDDLRKRRRG